MVVQEDPNVVSWDSPRVASVSRNVEPPLFVAIKRHLDKELAIVASSTDETGMDVLLPHREAFRMMIEGFPTYSPILCSIMASYDNALRYYAEVVASARGATSLLGQSEAHHKQEMELMQQKLQEMEKQQMEVSLNVGLSQPGAQHNNNKRLSVLQAFRGGAGGEFGSPSSPNTSNQKVANQVKLLEKERSDDLEKMITLIHAVKESELRSKFLEDTLQSFKTQVDSIPRLRKELADSIEEITQLRDTYRDSVPQQRFTMTKQYLERAVADLELELKRVRRVCAARGSQIDALQKVVESTRGEFAMAKVRKLRDQLSPRPSWITHYQSLPDLKELTQPLPAEPVNKDGDEPSTKVEAPSSTVVQVTYIVDQLTRARSQIASLEQALRESQFSLNAALNAAAAGPSLSSGNSPHSSPHGSLQDGVLPGIAKGDSLTPVHTRGSTGAATENASDLGATRKISALTSSASGVITPSLSTLAATPGSIKPPTMPLIGHGTGPTVPCYLHAVGVVRRRPVDHAKLRELTYDFFDMGLRHTTSLDVGSIGQLFLAFLEGARTSHPDMRDVFTSASMLCYNFIESAQREGMLRGDPLIQCLLAMLNGAVPGRIATDAVGVVEAVKKEIQLLAEGLQRNRVRRSAIMEVTAPLLVYKDRDELEELRTSLGVESTIDIPTLLFRRSKFTEVLFEQEIVGGLKLYTSFVQRLTELSEIKKDGRMMVSTSNVLKAIVHVEPKTPQSVIMMMVPDTTTEEQHSVESVLTALSKAPLVRRSPPALESSSANSMSPQRHESRADN